MFNVRHINLVLYMGILAGCGEQAEQRFNEFCEENISALSAEPIKADAVELRGPYSAIGTRILYDGIFEFLEFQLGDDPNVGFVWERPDQAPKLTSGAYRMSLFEQVGPECRLWASVAIEKPMQNDEDISNYYGNKPCVGIMSVDAFESDFYAVRLEDNAYRSFFFRKVKADIIRVFRSSDSELAREVESYSVDIGLPIIYFDDWRYCKTDAEGNFAFYNADVLRFVFE